MDDIQELYQDTVMEHNRRPRNFRRLRHPSATAEGFNPLCGDHLTLDLTVDGETITEVGFVGAGCAISKASASLMTEAVRGKSTEEAEELFESFRRMMTRGIGEDYDADLLGDLEALSGLTEFPVRIKCATLSWHTLRNACLAVRQGLDDTIEPATTE